MIYLLEVAFDNWQAVALVFFLEVVILLVFYKKT